MALTTTILKKVANTAVMHFKQSFQDEGFTDENLVKWKEVRRREDSRNFKTVARGKNKGTVRAKNANGKRKILTGTGDLGRSIQSKIEPGKVTVISDVPYASAHNEGTNNAGRNRNVTIPKRQFIGDSKVLNEKINNVITDELDKILGI